jgi:hypothetical protein
LLAAFVVDALNVSSACYWRWCPLGSRAAPWLWPGDRPSPPFSGSTADRRWMPTSASSRDRRYAGLFGAATPMADGAPAGERCLQLVFAAAF